MEASGTGGVIAHIARLTVFFAFTGAGLAGFPWLPHLWGWAAFVAGFLVGGTMSMLVFKRLATEQQIKDDLEARLHND